MRTHCERVLFQIFNLSFFSRPKKIHNYIFRCVALIFVVVVTITHD